MSDMREIRTRVRELASDPDLSAAEIHRRLEAGADGAPPVTVRYEFVRQHTRKARRPSSTDKTPAGMAQRILALLKPNWSGSSAEPARCI